ncbi:MAG: glutamate--tRNA ligase [Phycisphaerae bacterium]|nr:glutamate--tRNA ligase [Phycisphaerae bacterium]
MPEVVTRFAPSPTGHLHIGGARTALFCWAFARRSGGRFMIRIEDTDAARSSEESARGILEDLAWLGIEWDDGPRLRLRDGRTLGDAARPVGPYFQAQRVPIYDAHLDFLMSIGRAYPAFETPEELELRRKDAVARKATYKYARPADVRPGVAPAERIGRARTGERHVVRFVMPDEPIVVRDEVLGEVRFAAGEVDDFVIRKADGLPTYHFAVVIDDELMGVTHVLRAQEHLINTPRHVALQGALRRVEGSAAGAPFRTPAYAHMPLIFNVDGSKMSKRDKAKAARKSAKEAMAKDATLTAAALARRASLDESALGRFLAADTDDVSIAEALAEALRVALPEIEVWDFRRNGYVPEAITNFVSLLGWSPGTKDAQGRDVEKFDLGFLAANFGIERIGKTNARFDRVKLASFNGDYLAALSDAEFGRRWREWAREHEAGALDRFDDARLEVLARAVKPRCKTFRDALRAAAFALSADDSLTFDRAAADRHLLASDRAGLNLIGELRAVLAGIEPFEPATINAAIEAFAKSRGLGMGAVAQPVRVAVTGSTVSPGLGETLAVLGRVSVLARLTRCERTYAP